MQIKKLKPKPQLTLTMASGDELNLRTPPALGK